MIKKKIMAVIMVLLALILPATKTQAIASAASAPAQVIVSRIVAAYRGIIPVTPELKPYVEEAKAKQAEVAEATSNHNLLEVDNMQVNSTNKWRIINAFTSDFAKSVTRDADSVTITLIDEGEAFRSLRFKNVSYEEIATEPMVAMVLDDVTYKVYIEEAGKFSLNVKEPKCTTCRAARGINFAAVSTEAEKSAELSELCTDRYSVVNMSASAVTFADTKSDLDITVVNCDIQEGTGEYVFSYNGKTYSIR